MVERKVTVDGVLGGQPDGVVCSNLNKQLSEKEIKFKLLLSVY